jgi:hypothetical protein
MLLAVGADPRRCGYTTEQIDRCLRELPGMLLHQEEETSRQTLYLLNRGGFIHQHGDAGGSRQTPVKPAPLAEKIRLHPLISPVDDIPSDLRPALFKILLPYTRGAVRFEQGTWKETSPRELFDF